MTATRIPFQTYVRAAALQLVVDYAQAVGLVLTAYPGRPRTIAPPHAFIDRMREAIDFDGAYRKRLVQADVRIVWGLFDSKEAVDQRDAFVDGFVDWVTDRPHQAYGTTELEPRSVDDDPDFVPDWVPEQNRKTYFSSIITLEGYAGGR